VEYGTILLSCDSSVRTDKVQEGYYRETLRGKMPAYPHISPSMSLSEYDIHGDGGSANREPMAGGIAKAVKP
jgi:hypothetical protein